MTVKERMSELMDDLFMVVHRIAENEKATPEEIALLPELTQTIVLLTSFV